jgi:GT2 family glycosyltransferase
MMTKRVEVVVLNWNGWKDTLACLMSLQTLDYPNFHVTVVDNASSDDSVAQIAMAMPAVEILQSGANLGFGGGCNVGIRKAMSRKADYVWLINSDATAHSSALSALVKMAESADMIGAVGSVIFDAGTDDRVQVWGGGQVKLWSGRCSNQHARAPLDFISGASMLLRCDAVAMIGVFDDSTFFMYWEDTDLAFRLKKCGWKLAVAEDSRVWHKQSASVGGRGPALDRYFTQSGVRFLRRYAALPSVSIAFMLTRMLIKRLLLRDMTRLRAVIQGSRSA